MRKIIGIVLSSIALLGMGFGFWTLYETEIRLINSIPTTSVIKNKRIERVQDGSELFYATARYRYNVDGEFYVGDKIFVIDFQTPMHEYLATQIDPLPINVTTVAFYNKYNPQDSFLTKSIPYPPYVAILASLLIFTGGLYLVMTPSLANRSARKLGNGFYEMASSNANLVEIEKAYLTKAIVFSVISTFTFMHYFWHSPRLYSIVEIASVCVFILIGAQFWKQARDCIKRVRAIGDLRLELESAELELNKDYKAKIYYRVGRETQIVSSELGVRGHKTNIYGPVESETWYQTVVDKKVDSKSEFKLDQAFCVSTDSKGDAFVLVIRIQTISGMHEWNFPLHLKRSI